VDSSITSEEFAKELTSYLLDGIIIDDDKGSA